MIRTCDSGYLGREQFDAVYAVQSQGEWAVIDAATQPTSEHILTQLLGFGALAEQVRYLMITHVHLDHSGGAAALMERFPHATLLCHSRALKHLVDPSRLVQSASQIYGAEKFRALYGDIKAIDASRIRTVEEGERIDLGSGQFQFLETPGHAKHHISILWEEAGALFSGDALGLAYPSLGGMVCASTSPVDFDPQAALQTIERARALGLRALYPTHFGEVSDIASHLDKLERSVRTSERLARAELKNIRNTPSLERIENLKAALLAETTREVERLGLTWGQKQWEWLDLDLDLNAQGLAHWVEMQNRKSGDSHAI